VGRDSAANGPARVGRGGTNGARRPTPRHRPRRCHPIYPRTRRGACLLPPHPIDGVWHRALGFSCLRDSERMVFNGHGRLLLLCFCLCLRCCKGWPCLSQGCVPHVQRFHQRSAPLSWPDTLPIPHTKKVQLRCSYCCRPCQGELSLRALDLTADMISHNAADYTAWEWRWRCLRALGRDLKSEYSFTDSIMQVEYC
jgi:hypothetical protein